MSLLFNGNHSTESHRIAVCSNKFVELTLCSNRFVELTSHRDDWRDDWLIVPLIFNALWVNSFYHFHSVNTVLKNNFLTTVTSCYSSTVMTDTVTLKIIMVTLLLLLFMPLLNLYNQS